MNGQGEFVFGDDVQQEAISFYKILLAPNIKERHMQPITVSSTISDVVYLVLDCPIIVPEVEKGNSIRKYF